MVERTSSIDMNHEGGEDCRSEKRWKVGSVGEDYLAGGEKGGEGGGRLSSTAGSPWPRSGRGEVFLISSEFLQQEIVINFKKLFPSKITSSSVRGLSPCCPIV